MAIFMFIRLLPISKGLSPAAFLRGDNEYPIKHFGYDEV